MRNNIKTRSGVLLSWKQYRDGQIGAGPIRYYVNKVEVYYWRYHKTNNTETIEIIYEDSNSGK